MYVPHRDKFEFTNPNLFRAGDEFIITKNGILYLRLRDEKS